MQESTDENVLNMSFSELICDESFNNSISSPCVLSESSKSGKSSNNITVNKSLRFDEDDGDCDFKSKPLHKGGQQRLTYLITYSKADPCKCASREDFANICVTAFGHDNHEKCEECTMSKNCKDCKSCDVMQWACSEEFHKNGEIHYHLAIKLKKRRRFAKIRQKICDKYGVNVNFQEFTTQYFDAFKYVTKDDTKYIQSLKHPPLSNSPPRTLGASMSVRKRTCDQNLASSLPLKTKKTQRLSKEELYNIIVKYEIKDLTKLSYIANIQLAEGKLDLHNYVMSNPSSKYRQDMIDTVWSIKNAPILMKEKSKSRMDYVNEAVNSECENDCSGVWYKLAIETLSNNNVKASDFAFCIREALIKGRGKMRNIMIYGESNCAKSFLLKPLKHVFKNKIFVNPGETKFSWAGVIDKEIIYLNDIRYDENKTMSWDKFLNLLEGETVHINMPKNHFSEDYAFNATSPIFATADAPIMRVHKGKVLQTDTNMMMKRWKLFHFTYAIPDDKIIEISPCGKCFAKLITEN